MTLATLFPLDALPACPAGARGLIDSYAQVDLDAPALFAPVQADAAWHARSLQLAAALCAQAGGVGAQPASLAQAQELLGLSVLRNVLLAALLRQSVPASAQAPGRWPYALGTACAASWLAQVVEEEADLAFAIGLLYGVGQLASASALPAEQARPNLAQHWGFAERLSLPLAWVHAPLHGGRWATLAAITHVAAWRTQASLLNWPNEQAQASCPLELARVLGVPFEWHAQLATLAGVSDELMGPMPCPVQCSADWVLALG
jgi:hypothetical protein